MRAADRAAIRWVLRRHPPLLEAFDDERPRSWYDEQDRLQRLEAERLAEHDAQPCTHYERTDWIDVNTCGCGELVF